MPGSAGPEMIALILLLPSRIGVLGGVQLCRLTRERDLNGTVGVKHRRVGDLIGERFNSFIHAFIQACMNA